MATVKVPQRLVSYVAGIMTLVEELPREDQYGAIELALEVASKGDSVGLDIVPEKKGKTVCLKQS